MTDVDTAALRADAEAMRPAGLLRLDVTTATLRALCDGYDEAQRLRGRVVDLWECDGCGFAFPLEYHDADDPTSHTCPVCAEARLTNQRDAARQALADLVADLRALCDAGEDIAAAGLLAVIDRHAPEEAP